MTSSFLITLKDIVKKYHLGSVESTVLKKISLSVMTGDWLAIVGASGSGKSTLMNIIGLLDTPDQGTYLLEGVDVRGLSEDERASLRNLKIGFVFQQFNLLPRFTAEQNVALPLTYRNQPPELIKQRVHDVLGRVGMRSFKEHRPTQLSGGQQQRVAIARALIGEPEMLLADEPTGALDSATGHDIMALFRELHDDGRTIIMVTHDEHVANVCARRITLADGEIVAMS